MREITADLRDARMKENRANPAMGKNDITGMYLSRV